MLLSGVDRRLSSVSESVSYTASVSKHDFPFLLSSGQDSNSELLFVIFFRGVRVGAGAAIGQWKGCVESVCLAGLIHK